MINEHDLRCSALNIATENPSDGEVSYGVGSGEVVGSSERDVLSVC